MDWLSQANYLGAFLVGLLGGVHCIGMCGGIVTALSFNTPNSCASTPSIKKTSSQLSILLGYNLGRIAGYMLAGALLGGVSSGLLSLTDIELVRVVLSLLAAVFMMALGLYLAGIWKGITLLEKGGGVLWRYIEPLSRRFIPATHFYKAVPLGLLWGWLPCGLVYTILIWSLTTGSALKGALLMLAFGLGTLPNLLAMGLIANRLSRFTRNEWVKKVAGSLVFLFGVLMFTNTV